MHGCKKIFSLFEEKGEGALFGSKIQKEESEILKYLTELRDFKKANPKEFAMIKKLPNKARCGRNAKGQQKFIIPDSGATEIKMPLQETSIAYLKSDNYHGVFCLVTAEQNSIEINFLQAVKVFKADADEKPIPLHKRHHQQTNEALMFFITEKNQENVNSVSRKNLSPAENKSISNLNAILIVAQTEQKTNSVYLCFRSRCAEHGSVWKNSQTMAR